MSAEEPPEAPSSPTPVERRKLRWLLPGVILCVLLGIGLIPLIVWQQTNLHRAESLSNIRRVAQGALLYSQDWDSRPVPIAYRSEEPQWVTWPRLLKPYVENAEKVFSNPSNPVTPFHSTLKHPRNGYPIDSSFALNRRFWDTFASGPFPLENLEMPEQTIFFVEAGPMWGEPHEEIKSTRIGLLDYGDTLDRFEGLVPYPSTHAGRMAVVAADGHGLIVTVEHYSSKENPHDPRYGRVGQTLYNWNGGHPNGETDLPPRE